MVATSNVTMVVDEEGGEGQRQHHRGAADGRERETGSVSPMVATSNVTMLVVERGRR
jgi:hypothetical protein